MMQPADQAGARRVFGDRVPFATALIRLKNASATPDGGARPCMRPGLGAAVISQVSAGPVRVSSFQDGKRVWLRTLAESRRSGVRGAVTCTWLRSTTSGSELRTCPTAGP